MSVDAVGCMLMSPDSCVAELAAVTTLRAAAAEAAVVVELALPLVPVGTLFAVSVTLISCNRNSGNACCART